MLHTWIQPIAQRLRIYPYYNVQKLFSDVNIRMVGTRNPKVKWCILPTIKNSDSRFRCKFAIVDFSMSVACSGESLDYLFSLTTFKLSYRTKYIIVEMCLNIIMYRVVFFFFFITKETYEGVYISCLCDWILSKKRNKMDWEIDCPQL